MAETTPPPPKSGGSGPIIIAAVLMLLLIGGLIVWKVIGSSDAPKPVTPVANTGSVQPTLDEPPPPPPPPPVVEDAGKPEDKPKTKVASGPNPCSKACTGSASGGLQSALSGRAAQSRGCYETALRNNATLEGTITVAVKVGPDGAVCGARVVADGLHDPGVTNCVINKFAGAKLPPAEGGCAEVNVPLRFMPKK
jgi:outer membrane biosynthesis protein TonB